MTASPKTTETISRSRIRAKENGRTARGLDRLAARYGWSPEEAEKVRTQLKRHTNLIQRYWQNLAIAHAAGFVQSEENGFITLQVWCAQNGWLNPTLFDLENQLRLECSF